MTTPAREEWRVAVLALPGSLGTAVVGTVEVFAAANLFQPNTAPPVRVEVVGVGAERVSSFGGLDLPTSTRADALGDFDVVIIPPIIGTPEGVIEEHREVVQGLVGADAKPGVLAAACTGTFLLAETGSLDGRRATTTPAFQELFAARYPNVLLRTALRVVDEGPVVTAGATTSYLDLALALVGRLLGPRVALDSAKFFSTDANPRSQQPFLLPRAAIPHTDQEIRRAESWIGANLGKPSDTSALARIAGLGDRTFLRRFRAATGESPREYLQRLRVEAAMKDLEATNLSIEEITFQCGYEDPRSFRRLFRRQTGVSPAEYRRRFGYGNA